MTLWGVAETCMGMLDGCAADDGSGHLAMHKDTHTVLMSGVLSTVPEFVAVVPSVSPNLVHLTSASPTMSQM